MDSNERQQQGFRALAAPDDAPDDPGHTARRIARAMATAAADTDLGPDTPAAPVGPAAAAPHDGAGALPYGPPGVPL